MTTDVKVSRLQKDVSEVKYVMKDNILNIQNRGVSLEQLEGKAEDLQYSAEQFRKNAKAVRWKMWCRNTRMSICIIVTVAIAILITVIIVLVVMKPWEKAGSAPVASPPSTLSSSGGSSRKLLSVTLLNSNGRRY